MSHVEEKSPVAVQPAEKYTALGHLAGSNRQVLVLEQPKSGEQMRVAYSDYAVGKYDHLLDAPVCPDDA
jgi:hypothetical protein